MLGTVLLIEMILCSVFIVLFFFDMQNELHEIMSELRSKESDVRRVTDQLQSLDSDTALDIDEVVVASYPLHRQ